MSAVPVALRPARTDHVQRARVGFRGRPPCAPPERRRPQVQWRGDCRGCGGQRLGRPASGMESARQRANATALACLRARGVGGSDFARGAASRRRGRRAPRRNPHCPNSSSGELQ